MGLYGDPEFRVVQILTLIEEKERGFIQTLERSDSEIRIERIPYNVDK